MSFFNTTLWRSVPVPPFWIGAGALWIFSAAVSAMDAPQPDDRGFYRWLYRFTHLLAANLNRAFGAATLDSQQQHKPVNKEKS